MILFKNKVNSFKGLIRLNACNGYFFSIVRLNMPCLGEQIKGGTIKKFYVKEGDYVREFQKLALVASDKQVTQLTASDSGIIHEVFSKENDVCQAGDLLLEIEANDENCKTSKPGPQKSHKTSQERKNSCLYEQFNITEIEKMKKYLLESNKKVTLMSLLIKTFSLALKHYPKMNSLYYPNVNPYTYNICTNHDISIAMSSPKGLVFPHIKDVSNMKLTQIQEELERLTILAKGSKLTPKELQGGTVCLSNVEHIGATNSFTLVLPPQVCMVAIGKLQAQPKQRQSQSIERKVIKVSFGCDDRVNDRVQVAGFANTWKKLVEYPNLSEMI